MSPKYGIIYVNQIKTEKADQKKGGFKGFF